MPDKLYSTTDDVSHQTPHYLELRREQEYLGLWTGRDNTSAMNIEGIHRAGEEEFQRVSRNNVLFHFWGQKIYEKVFT